MRPLLILVLFGCFMVRGLSRPSHPDDRDVEEVEYEGGGDGPDVDESLRDDDDSANEQESTGNGQDEEASHKQRLQNFNANTNLRRSTNDDNFSDNKSSRNNEIQNEKAESVNSDNEYQSLLEHRQANRYSNTDDQSKILHLTNRDINNMIPQNEDNQVKKFLGSHSLPNEEGDFLFENNDNAKEQTNKADMNGYNNEAADSSEQSRYFKQYSNTMQVDNRGMVNRDRREIPDSDGQKEPVKLLSTSNKNEDLVKATATEDEEAAIKRHVKKLSGEELQELLDSLSEDKRELLKKIMDGDDNFKENVNKREITKKAGAIEETNLEGGQADSSKLQLGSSSMDINTGAPSTGSTEPEKQPEPQPDINDLSAAKSAENLSSSANSENKAEFKNGDLNQSKLDNSLSSCAPVDSKSPGNLDAELESNPKSEIKRETNLDDLTNVDLSFDDSKVIENDFNLKDSQDSLKDHAYLCSSDDDLEQLMNDESQLHSSSGNLYKREAFLEQDLSDSMKSLEESFPNSNAYDGSDPYSGSDMAPLVRVKRKNDDLVVKKRAAGVLPDAKVAYFPYRAENDDEDNDEGNEFDDEGFYDRPSSLAKNNVNDKPIEENTGNIEVYSRLMKAGNKNGQSKTHSKLSQGNDNMQSDAMSLGSDTDGVLSGVEGVDDNLMYSSGSRNRRKVEDNPKVGQEAADVTDLKLSRPLRSTPLIDGEINTPSENYINNYQESDSFGSLPRNYEGELSRYKRVRRVKQPPVPQEIAHSSS